jgi:hypothetical protein
LCLTYQSGGEAVFALVPRSEGAFYTDNLSVQPLF